MSRLSTLLPLGITGCLALGGVAVMAASGPSHAEPLPTTYSASAQAALWHVDTLDLGFSGTPKSVDLSVLHAAGALDSTAADRTQALADNLAGTTAEGQGARRGVGSVATAKHDTSQPTVGIAPSGGIDGTLAVGQVTLGSRGRWVGDKSCLGTADGLTDASAVGGAASLAPSQIPTGGPGGVIGLPVDLPSTIPTELPSPTSTGLPTSLPTVLPTEQPTGLPTTLPTELPTILPTGLPTILPTTLPTILPTELPTTVVPLPTLTATPTGLPTLPLPTITGLPVRADAAAADSSGVPLAAVSAGTVQQRVDLPTMNDAKRDVRGVRAQAVGTVKDTSAPAMTFFGGEVEVRVNGPARLTAYADGLHPSVLDWAPPVVTVSVPAQGKTYALPASGSPLTVTYSKNNDVTLTLSAGTLTEATGRSTYDVGGRASVLHMRVTDGDDTALEGDFMPMQAAVHAPGHGVECPIPDTDRDGLNDELEAKLGTKPGVPDTDRDGLRDGPEHFKFRTNPLRADTDRDKLTDGREVRKYKTDPRKRDTDGDRLTDGQEVTKYKTSPRKKDTDRDGVPDGVEVRHHRDPLHKGR